MENQNNIHKGWRTREQKEELILQWQQSGKSRKEFCKDEGLNYNSLVTWGKQIRDKKPHEFTEVKLQTRSDIFAQVHLPGGIKIDFYQSLPAEYFQSLFRK